MDEHDNDDVARTPRHFNVSSDADDFFQSDRDLDVRQRRQARVNYTRGRSLQLKSKILALALAPDSRQLYAATSGFGVTRIDATTKRIAASYAGLHRGPVTSLALSDDERQFVSGSWDKTAALWDIETRKALRSFKGHSDFVKAVAVTGNTVFTGSSDWTVRQWDRRSDRVVAVLQGHTRPVEALAIHADRLFSASSDSTVRRWDVATCHTDLVYVGHATTVFALAIAHDDETSTLFTASADKTLRRWDVETAKEEAQVERADWIKAIALCGPHVVTAGRDELVTVWDVAQMQQPRREIAGHFDEVTSLAVHGSTIISGSLDCTIRFWDLAAPEKDDLSPPTAPATVTLTAEEEAELAELIGDDTA